MRACRALARETERVKKYKKNRKAYEVSDRVRGVFFIVFKKTEIDFKGNKITT